MTIYSFFAHAWGTAVPSLSIELFDTDQEAQSHAARLALKEPYCTKLEAFQGERVIARIDGANPIAPPTVVYNRIARFAPVKARTLGERLTGDARLRGGHHTKVPARATTSW